MPDNHDGIPSSVEDIRAHCTNCTICVKDCPFLSRYGSPLDIATRLTDSELRKLAYSCSLCGQCHQACPLDLDPGQMFYDLRQLSGTLQEGHSKKHLPLLLYEYFGARFPFSHLQIPSGATTLFYPGCTLTGIRPKEVLALYQLLKKVEPQSGIMLDCCNKISADLGSAPAARKRQSKRLTHLAKRGIKQIITGCPSCLQMLTSIDHELRVISIYTFLASHPELLQPHNTRNSQSFAIHDPCTFRFSAHEHQSIRAICSHLGIQIKESANSQAETFCCGEGGGIRYMAPELSNQWANNRLKTLGGTPLITYCAGCTQQFSGKTPGFHLVDLLFSNVQQKKMQSHPTGSIRNWLNRFLVKIRLIAGLG